MSEGATLPGSGRIEGRRHLMPVRVYYEDTDAGGIVYHANYLRFAERARTEFLRLLGCDQRELAQRAGLAFAVRGAELRFVTPARLDDVLVVRSRMLAVRGASITAEQVIERETGTVARIVVEVACIDRQGRPARLPKDLRAACAAFVEREGAGDRPAHEDGTDR